MIALHSRDGTTPDRDVVFISHATPDDNEFVRWLGTRLTGFGYKVWADIFDLAGGTPFWNSIEEAIRKKSLRQTTLLMELADEQGLTVNTPREPHRRGNTVCVDFEGSEDASLKLIERGYIIDWRPNGGVRISPHFYNDESDLAALASVI